MWFRRDLRVHDNPALRHAVDDGAGGPVLPLFVFDPALWEPSGPSRRAYLVASLAALTDDVPVQLRRGDPREEVVAAARAVGATRVHVAADYGPYGARRDEDVEKALADAGIELVRTGSPYAVAPGRVRTGSGGPYQVFTPFSRAWREHGWRGPVAAPTGVDWSSLEDTVALPDVDLPDGLDLPAAGEAAARARWEEFLERVADYDEQRDRPGVDGTSRLSHHLKYGELHPRTLLADLEPLIQRGSDGATTFRQEIAWREFYADVLHRRPDTARDYYRPEFAAMDYDEPGPAFDAWREGRTGFPVVDAGMRQLRATGWMHNRVRMITASFLVKDLHVEWQHGARHFMRWLVDGDLASNQHGWQWTAGCGTDAAPYFRVFNPTAQGTRFDPAGDYVRRWVPELADARKPHEPTAAERRAGGYPAPIVDHAAERTEALDRYHRLREQRAD